ncbi:hypothetical protein OsI_35684 [Oryza sativa Indica Group]|uniref:Uncharacterized protein n=2 Tax=Oryza TaxID=4527 RepID=A0A0E0J088_ORYNI|nr:hypothetical protein OsI_35684 [Oryza sativa Indica Group]
MSNQSDGDSPTHDDSLDEVSSIDPMDLYPLDEISSILGDLADHVIKSCYFGAVVLLVEMLWIKFVHLEELLMS